jgi:hypothetical protein
MSIEDRLHALVAQARQQHGDAFLKVPGQLVPRLIGRAPDLHAEIKAVAAAIEGDAAGRLAAAADKTGESARIAAEIATKERLSIGPVNTALAVAARLGSLGGPGAAPESDGWAGDSIAVGAGPSPSPIGGQPHYQPPPLHPHAPAPQPAPAAAAEPIWKNKLALGVVGAAAAFFIYQSQQGGDAPVNGTGPVVGENSTGPVVPPVSQGQPERPPMTQQPAGGLPTLQPPGGNVPALTAQPGQNGSINIGFQIQTQNGPMAGFIVLPPGGWDNGPGTFAFLRPGNTNPGQPDTVGQARFQQVGGQSRPVRVAQPQWQQDNAGLGSICIAFMGQGGQGAPGNPGQGGQSADVGLQGADMCVMDGACNQAAGCGRIQVQATPGGR